jgi:tripartite-type tricarboxylate transporter receptor subunit TctC
MTKLARRALLAAPLAAPALAQAQAFPSRPVTLIVAFSAGGSSDAVSRALAEPAARLLGQNIVVENRPGGNTTIAATAIARARPDGYTLGQMSGSGVRMAFMQRLTYDPRRDFTPIIQVAGFLIGILVRVDSPYRDWREFVAGARQRPGQLTVGNAGAHGAPHLTVDELARREGVQVEHVSFRGEAEMLQALLGGHIVGAAAGSVGGRLVTEGRARWLNIWTPERSPRWPEAPTLRDLGYDMVVTTPWGFVGPAGMPEPVVRRLHDAFRAAMDDPGYRQTLENLDIPPAPLGPEEYATAFREMIETEEALVRRLGLGPA